MKLTGITADLDGIQELLPQQVVRDLNGIGIDEETWFVGNTTLPYHFLDNTCIQKNKSKYLYLVGRISVEETGDEAICCVLGIEFEGS